MVKKSILTFLAFALLIGPISGQTNSTTRYYSAYSSETLTIAGTALGYTASKLHVSGSQNQANATQFRVECATGTTCPIRYTVDGTTPTSTVGSLLQYGDTVIIYGIQSNTAFRAIRTTSVSATLYVTYSF